MILITSAAYVNREFQVEFGSIPPCFLPLGNKKLIQHQVTALRKTFKSVRIFVTLPASYHLNRFESKILSDCRVEVVRCNDKLSLGGSIKFALKSITEQKPVEFKAPIRILHGDTLVISFPKTLNFIGVSTLQDDYHWEIDHCEKNIHSIWCGCFGLSSVSLLLKKLQTTKRFEDAIRSIDSKEKLARVKIRSWMDFGHINTYFQSRSKLTTERSFNTLEVKHGCVKKTGLPSQKIIAERKWYQGLPTSFRCFSPQLIDFGKGKDGIPYYTTEYLPIPPLNEIFVHGRNSSTFWQRTLRLCTDYLKKCHNYSTPGLDQNQINAEFMRLARDKTRARLELFEAQNKWFKIDKPINLNKCCLPSIQEITDVCVKLLENTKPIPGLLHGDFCFSNILYDSRSGIIKLIDPRGLDSDGNFSNVGDIRYDMAKLSHSVIGLYDFIVSGAFDCRMNSGVSRTELDLNIFTEERIEKIQKEFLASNNGDVLSGTAALPMVVLLFFSMLPLHNDNPERQVAFLANGCRVFLKYIR